MKSDQRRGFDAADESSGGASGHGSATSSRTVGSRASPPRASNIRLFADPYHLHSNLEAIVDGRATDTRYTCEQVGEVTIGHCMCTHKVM